LGKTKYISKSKTVEKLPTIEQNHLMSGVVYQDGQFDDARLAINLTQTIIEKGGTAINYMKVVNLLKNDSDKIIELLLKISSPRNNTRSMEMWSSMPQEFSPMTFLI
jgi:glycerol-3-phosphate dehydrogenase